MLQIAAESPQRITAPINETVSRNGNIKPLSKRKKTVCDDHFYCPRCECKITSDSLNRGNIEA